MLHPNLRLRHLHCFLETARQGSLSAAAEALHVSQPAASKTIRDLEDILKVELFDRSSRRLTLTPAGKLFQQRAGAAIADLERAQDMMLAPLHPRRKLVIGALPTAATGLLPRAALRFQAERPDCTMRVSTGPNWLLLSQLREGALDIVVGRMPPTGNFEGLSFRQLYWERVVPVVRPGHPLDQPDWDPAMLVRFPLMLPPKGAVISASVSAWFHAIGISDPVPAYENVSLAFGRGIVRESDTIWFISEGVVRPEIEAGLLVALPIENALLGGPVGISLRRDDPPSEDLAALIAALEGAVMVS